ncbi:hypothetical protein [Micromonospora sp. URMC 103]|uniref:hypothetical protein n=1 Tax=Micromonospora sp. URMC 103 TaxID=3423406 RepID=UPI003F1AACC6
MAEQDPLRTHFAAYRHELTARVDGPGPDAARRTLRRRRRATVAAGAALAVALVVAPIAATAALRGDATPPAPPATTPTVEPTPTPSSPSPSASTSPSATPSVPRTPEAPDGRISERELLAARLDLPAWQVGSPTECATEGVRLTLRPPLREAEVPHLIAIDQGDVDADGAAETVALLGCRLGETVGKQVVAFDRNDRGKIVTLGRVNRTAERGDRSFEDILAVDVTQGAVRVQVGDIQPCCGVPEHWQRHQWRTYRWDGERFGQSGGPTSWGKDPRLTDLKLTRGPVVLKPVDETGTLAGTVVFTVTNRGPVDVDHVAFTSLATFGDLEGGDASRCQPPRDGVEWPECLTDGLKAGESRGWTFRFRFGPDQPSENASVHVEHYDADYRRWPDLKVSDNTVPVAIGR